MWESPRYIFNKKIYDNREKAKNIKIKVDVTGSAPSMKEPGDYLENIFELLTKGKNPKETIILDVGAAKLRNTIHLLNKGFTIYSVEFPELFKRMNQAKKNLDLANKYPNFKPLIFPKDLFNLKEKVDIILLINVINVMPLPEERLVLLSLCREKIKKNGLLLWYGWRDISANPDKYSEKTKLNDGFFKGEGREYKTFHGEWNREYVLEMHSSAGFSLNKTINLGNVGTNQAYLFNPDQPLLLEKYLKLNYIKKGAKKRDPKKSLKEIGEIFFPYLYLQELKRTSLGARSSTKFHRLIARLLTTIFDYQLKNLEIEKEVNERRARIDIRFKNRNENGFFKNITDLRNIICPSVFFECKNYKKDPNNPEFDQLSGRLNKKRGMFGILVCRNIADKEKAIKHCRDRLKKDEYIIVLDDEDMEKLVKEKLENGDEGINDYMENKLDEVID